MNIRIPFGKTWADYGWRIDVPAQVGKLTKGVH